MQMNLNTLFNDLLLYSYYKLPVTFDKNLTATVQTWIGYQGGDEGSPFGVDISGNSIATFA